MSRKIDRAATSGARVAAREALHLATSASTCETVLRLDKADDELTTEGEPPLPTILLLFLLMSCREIGGRGGVRRCNRWNGASTGAA